MKALSLWQPWASLVVLGIKKIETRSWATDYRGPIIIHSTASVPPPAHEEWRRGDILQALKIAGVADPRNLPMGMHLGVVDLMGTVPAEEARAAYNPGLFELSLGNYNPGRFAWLLAHARELNEPLPAAGHQRLWNPPIEVIEQVREALA